MKGYFIDSDSMSELWARLTEIDLDDVNREPQAIINDVLQILDKYKAESEDNE